MTEKQYGGATSFGLKDNFPKNLEKNLSPIKNILNENMKNEKNNFSYFTNEEIEKLKKAGRISSQAREFARSLIKPNMPLLEIAEKIESKIIELGGKPAFPVNLSINEIAAHSTPSFNDSQKAFGLLKVDLGVHIDGYIADTAFSLSLEENEENKKLIEAAEKALKNAIEKFSLGLPLKEIGKEVERTITSFGFVPIANLSGHSIIPWILHSGINIPNVSNSSPLELEEGVYAIEPFSTSGFGSVKEGKPSGIYNLEKESKVRDLFARNILQYIKEEYRTLPFCSRWLVKKFGSRALIALQRLEEAKIIHQYPQLIESGKGKVAQAEHTIILTNKEKIISTI